MHILPSTLYYTFIAKWKIEPRSEFQYSVFFFSPVQWWLSNCKGYLKVSHVLKTYLKRISPVSNYLLSPLK